VGSGWLPALAQIRKFLSLYVSYRTVALCWLRERVFVVAAHFTEFGSRPSVARLGRRRGSVNERSRGTSWTREFRYRPDGLASSASGRRTRTACGTTAARSSSTSLRAASTASRGDGRRPTESTGGGGGERACARARVSVSADRPT